MSDETNPDEGGGIANLRKQYEAAQKQLAEKDAELAGFRAAARDNSVKEVLKAKGLPEKVASLYTGEDVSEEAVGKWAEQYADVFGAQSQTPPPPVVDPNEANAARVSQAAFGQESTLSNQPDNAPQVLGDPAEMERFMRTAPYEELVKLGYLPQVEGTIFDTHGR